MTGAERECGMIPEPVAEPPARRYVVGDCLYDLHNPEPGPGVPDEVTEAYPIIRRTAQYVYVYPCSWKPRGRLVRFSVAELESTGSAYNHANRMRLVTRPAVHWPLCVVSINRANELVAP